MIHIFDGQDELKRLEIAERKAEREKRRKAEEEREKEEATWEGYEPPKPRKEIVIEQIPRPKKKSPKPKVSVIESKTYCSFCENLMTRKGTYCSRSCSGKAFIKKQALKPPKTKPPKPLIREPITYCNLCDVPMFRQGIYCSRHCSGKAVGKSEHNSLSEKRKQKKQGIKTGRKRTFVPQSRNCLKCDKAFETTQQNPGTVYCSRRCSNSINRLNIKNSQLWGV